ncbi:hypothetical protein [Flavivirga rizhaonensis]|uniref:Uncharacterized protein n=1 Tax=Flavivirga rizhaonensis TaxID=2559571 RepID=A0A4S1DVS0_9FLAO|nr:hypothetical protein [Flavivirga rizhaonensis]TGV01965.1 hypothetical protein EM932_13340 [Flavivirga rizhaonensis]
MKTNLTSTLFCSAYGHNYFRLNKTNTNTPQLICKSCKNYFKFGKNGDIVNVKQKQNILSITKTKRIV